MYILKTIKLLINVAQYRHDRGFGLLFIVVLFVCFIYWTTNKTTSILSVGIMFTIKYFFGFLLEKNNKKLTAA